MIFRRSTTEDIPSIMEIYAIARQSMRASGNTVQWVNGYPSQSLVEADIARGNHYVGEEEGVIVVAFALVFGDDPTYAVIEGAWQNDEPYATIHRIGSNGRRHGVLHETLEWCFSRINNIRIDTHKQNSPMLHLLEKEGFVRCGVIYVADGTPREAFQKKVRMA